MSKYFKNKDEFVKTLTALFERLKSDPKVGPDVAKAKIAIRFEYSDLGVSVLINGRDKPADPKDYLSYEWDGKSTEPDVTMSNSADFCHRFWHGKENPVMAIALGKIKIKGDAAKAMALLPAIKPAYKIYPQVLKEIGRSDIAL
ncbi:MAG TPA: SCP2 sterol-binding domain-containing protein [bacterium]|nr:SCP2 sterol-binding domain-containing protein [bacterium]